MWRLVGREEPEGFDIEGEVGGGALHPEVRVTLRWESVIGAVDLHERELSRVEAKTGFSGRTVLRVVCPRVDEGLIRPGRRSDLQGIQSGLHSF